jgi:hypothetical protein
MKRDEWGVHIHHCCAIHGCKYGDEDCPVWGLLVKQKYPCWDCDDEQAEKVMNRPKTLAEASVEYYDAWRNLFDTFISELKDIVKRDK